MLRIRVTTLESFRCVCQEEWGDEAELIESIRRGQEGPPSNWKMAAGSAWHKLLEQPIAEPVGEPALLLSGDYRFNEADVFAAQRHVGPGVCEVPGRLAVEVSGHLVLLTGTCDRIRGLTIRDAKTKFTTPDARDYELSLQWRTYLLIFGAERFLYDLFAFPEPDPTGLCRLREVVTFGFWRYPDMAADVRRWLEQFIAWADDRSLLPYLETAGVKALAQ